MTSIPQGRVHGPLRFVYLTPKGSGREHSWPARDWPSVRRALDVGHGLAAQHRIRSYIIELEIVREVARPEAPCATA